MLFWGVRTSSTLAREVIRGAEAAGWETSVYEIEKMHVRGCQGCRACKNNGIDCIVQDDLAPYWKELHECDALLVSAPNYASTVCGPMITYMNRHYCLLDKDWKPRIKPGIRLIGIFSQGQKDPEKYLANYNWYLGDFENRGMIRHKLMIHGGYEPLSQEELAQAFDAGRSLGTL